MVVENRKVASWAEKERAEKPAAGRAARPGVAICGGKCKWNWQVHFDRKLVLQARIKSKALLAWCGKMQIVRPKPITLWNAAPSFHSCGFISF
jgi:hypothetical protein